MPRWAKVPIWVVVFALCAAAGAWLASRTDPFPPGVQDPGARPTSDPTATRSPSPPKRWTGEFAAITEHRLHVGGTCRSDWRAKYRMRLRPDGSIDSGFGVAILSPGSAGCDFAQEQLQADSAQLSVGGAWEREGRDYVLRLRFRVTGLDPVGSLDLGGFLATIEGVEPVMRSVGPDPYADEQDVRRSDGNEGQYVAEYVFEATCRSGCP